jgi:hypothetical protein
MSAKQLGLPGRFARLYNNERFVDVTVLLATPGMWVAAQTACHTPLKHS